jgi:putative heme-binding domain-containing protein
MPKHRSFRYVRSLAALSLVLIGFGGFAAKGDDESRSNARTIEPVLRDRVRVGEGDRFEVRERRVSWKTNETAIIICDMWDDHHCKGAAARVAEMAPAMNKAIAAARDLGVTIIHAPSECMKFYKDHPARKRAIATPKAADLPADMANSCSRIDSEPAGAYPIDQSDGGCDCGPTCPTGTPWTRQIASIQIHDNDYISDSGAEIWNVFRKLGIKNVIIMGVHTNMCVVGRSFGLRNMARHGMNVALVRDLTDTMYNSRRRPYVSHFRGTDLVVSYIEKYISPSIESTSWTGLPPFRFKPDDRPRAVFVIGEDEYHTWETLPAFARDELEPRGIRCNFAIATTEKPNEFPGIEALDDADLLVLSVRRRSPKIDQLKRIQRFIESGKPTVAIRTACHAFDTRGKHSADEAEWRELDRDVLGGNYTGHHANGVEPTVVKEPGAESNEIIQGFPQSFISKGSLYRVNPLAKSTHVLLTGSIPGFPAEPVAWTNDIGKGRIFYTSLGHPADFQAPAFRTLLQNAIFWALARKAPESKRRAGEAYKVETTPANAEPAAAKSKPTRAALPPGEALKALDTPDDLKVDLVLAEPDIVQPVFINFDEKGRLWVVEYRQYPEPAGLKILSKDGVWRAIYDKIPEPPPRGVKGADRISIHEDADGDGVFEKHKIFVDGLNIATSCARGRGGVFVLNPPYLLFYADKNNDDIPDSDPEVLLEGFGLEDTHSVVNSLRWGPDGWLYAAQGSTVTANVRKPGSKEPPIHSLGQLIWRYHPESKKYEIFAEGGGNAFGVAIDSKGRIFSGHNGGDTRGFHYVQGGYYQKGFSKHGPLSNPYAFGYFPAMKGDRVIRFTHNLLIYDDGALPERYRGKLFGVDPLNHRTTLSELIADGSTFRTRELAPAISSRDPWFRPVDIKLGPDGSIYIADWYDDQVNHYRNHEGRIDKTTGRIYRLRSKSWKPSPAFDMNALTSIELVDALGGPKEWTRAEALRLIGDRKVLKIIPTYMNLLRTETGTIALAALWGLNMCNGIDEANGLALLDHPDPQVRLWTVRLLGDRNEVPSAIATKFVRMARVEKNVEVRSQLACSARRLTASACLPIVAELAKRSEDLNDIHIPLLLWWAIESKAVSDRRAVLSLFEDPDFWKHPIVNKYLAPRITRRYAATGRSEDLETSAGLIKLAPDDESKRAAISGVEAAMSGAPGLRIPDSLAKELGGSAGGSLLLGIRTGDSKAIAKAIQAIQEPNGDVTSKLQYIQAFGDNRRREAVSTLLDIAKSSNDPALRGAALAALRGYDDPAIPKAVLASFSTNTEDLRIAALELLIARPASTLELFAAIESGSIDPASIPGEIVAALRSSRDQKIKGYVHKYWGDERRVDSAELRGEIDRIKSIVTNGTGVPKKGESIFQERCARCHKMFDKGANVGPDLTSYKRDDLDTMLLNILNPSAEIREGYGSFVVATSDGRTIVGLIVEQDPRVVVLRGADGRGETISKAEIDEMKPSDRSLMPEGALRSLTDQQIRDLFAYLRITQPLIDK